MSEIEDLRAQMKDEVDYEYAKYAYGVAATANVRLGIKLFAAEARAEKAEALLQMADRFLVGQDRCGQPVYVESRGDAWCVTNGTAVLSIDGEWWSEPLPSNRDALFLANTRFTRDDAFAMARAALQTKEGAK